MAITGKKQQVQEIVKCGKNANYFMNNYGKIQHPDKGLITFKTFPFQDDCLDQFNEYRFNVALKSRQLGMSTLTAAYALWLGLFHRDKNILIIATKLSVAQNFIKKVKVMLKSLPKWMVLPEIIADNKQSVEFSHGSVIKAIPTSDDAGRSEALSLLIVDEAAFVRNFDTIWTGLYPTLSTGGRAILLSTPNGVGGQYHKIYQEAVLGENEFNPIKLLWDVHPERGEAWFQTETKNMSKRQVAQELLCDFVSSGETFLAHEDLEYVRELMIEPVDKKEFDRNLWIWKYPLSSHSYIVSADVARGDAKDFSTFHVIDTDESEVVAEYKGKVPPDVFGEMLDRVGRMYSDALICPENNTFGYTTCMKLKELKYPNLYYDNVKGYMIGGYIPPQADKIPGFSTQGKSRVQILAKLEEVIRNKEIKIYSERLIDELKTFVWKGNRASAQKGTHDDLVMALAIGVWLYEADGTRNQSNKKLNEVMLACMSNKGLNSQNKDLRNTDAQKAKLLNPFSPVEHDTWNNSNSNDPRRHIEQFGWLYDKKK